MRKVGGPPVFILAAARGQRRGERKGAKQCVAPHLPGGPHRQPVRAWRCSRATPLQVSVRALCIPGTTPPGWVRPRW